MRAQRKKSQDYTNRVEFYPHNTDNFVLSEGEAIYDDSGTLIGGGANATVHPSYPFGSGSVLTIDSNESHASGNDDPNKVPAEYMGDKVLYTMYVTNDSETAYDDLVLINRLPALGDKGTVNSLMSRKSEFDVELSPDNSREYLKNGLIAEYQIVDIGDTPVESNWISADDAISLTSEAVNPKN